MKRQPARVLEQADLCRVLAHLQTTRTPTRDQVIVLLSFKAGLRACEIAGLDWGMVLQSTGHISDALTVSRHIAKKGSGRVIPMQLNLRAKLRLLHKEAGKPLFGPVIRSQRGGHMTARGIVNWFREVYALLGLTGCSSHSGRRTFITQSARLLQRIGGSLRDIQELAGHRALTTTERYIEGDRDAQRKLISLL